MKNDIDEMNVEQLKVERIRMMNYHMEVSNAKQKGKEQRRIRKVSDRLYELTQNEIYLWK